MRSVYALAMSSAGTLVAAGTTESYIRLLDPRTGQKVMKLKVCGGGGCCFAAMCRVLNYVLGCAGYYALCAVYCVLCVARCAIGVGEWHACCCWHD
jgi:hypothetical protein